MLDITSPFEQTVKRMSMDNPYSFL